MKKTTYIVAVDYLTGMSSKPHDPYEYLKLEATNLKDAMIEAPAVVVDKLVYRAETLAQRVYCLRVLTQTKAQEKTYEATDCGKKYVVQGCRWVDSESPMPWTNVEAR